MYVCMHVSVFDEHWEMVLLPNTILMKMEKQERGKKEFWRENREKKYNSSEKGKQKRESEEEERNKNIWRRNAGGGK